jgi:hypothetical protein
MQRGIFQRVGLLAACSLRRLLRWRSPESWASYEMIRMLTIILCLLSSEAVAQHGASADKVSSMQQIMPVGARCAELEWEPVAYCTSHSPGATLELWSGDYGPGATLSFAIAGEEGLALMPTVRAHFQSAGIPVEMVDRCIRNSATVRIDLLDRSFELDCRFVTLGASVALEIVPRQLSGGAGSW